jgi:hypothetical protein
MTIIKVHAYKEQAGFRYIVGIGIKDDKESIIYQCTKNQCWIS